MKSAILRCAALAVLISLTGQGLAMAPSERGDRLSDAQVVKKTVLDGSRNVGSLKAEIEEILTQVARGDDIPRLKARLDSLRSLLPRRMPERSMDTGGERCEDAVTVPSLPFCDTGSTTGALNDYICQSGAFGSPDRVYLYTPEIDKTVTISLCGSGYDTGLHIWQSCPDDTEAVEICCDDDHCGLQSCCNGLSLLAGTAYYIIVDGYGSGSAGNYVIQIAEGVDCPATPCGSLPEGDACDDPFVIPSIPFTIDGSTVSFFNNYDHACPYTGSTASDVAYAYTPPVDQHVGISLCGGLTNYDSKLYVFNEAGQIIACNDDFCAAPNMPYPVVSHIECVALFAEQTYCVVVDGYDSESGDYTLTLAECQPCVVECSPIGRPEGESCPNTPDAFNGGCNSTPPVFSLAGCNDVVCGSARASGGIRDYDWYELTLLDAESLIVCVNAEFRPVLSIATPGPSGGCQDYQIIATSGGVSCETVCLGVCLEPRTYWIIVHPNGFDGVPCADYVLSTSCRPCGEPFECDGCDAPFSHTTESGGPIEDYPQCTDFVVYVPVQYLITDLDACVDLLHTWDSDLEIRLISPSGTEVTLSRLNGGAGDDYRCTGFDDEATLSIGQGAPPFTGSFVPQEALSRFDGEDARGNWIFRICDRVALDVGYLNWACLSFEYDIILAVELVSFHATAGDAQVSLRWTTAAEIDNDRFEVLRDGSSVARLASQGNSALTQTYEWLDEDVENGTTYRYVLVAVDFDGDRVELAVVEATPEFGNGVSTDFTLYQNYPNPFNGVCRISFDLPESGMTTLKVFDIMGRELAVLVNGHVDAGRHTMLFDAAGQPSGLYLYTLSTGSFVDTKKMLLIR